MGNLTMKNSYGHIVSSKCLYPNSDRGCITSSLPHCYDCAFISKEDIKDIFEKLYNYEKSGLVFGDIKGC